jgi:hypothetical protein
MSMIGLPVQSVLADFTDGLPAQKRTAKNNCEPSLVHLPYLSSLFYAGHVIRQPFAGRTWKLLHFSHQNGSVGYFFAAEYFVAAARATSYFVNAVEVPKQS